MDDFATAEQMEARSQGSVPASTPFLTEAIAAATDRIRLHCGWHIAPSETVEAEKVRAAGPGSLWLRTTHLTAVTAATSGGQPVDVTAIDWRESGQVDFPWMQPATITYTHGYAAVPPGLVALTLELALGDLLSRGVVREQSLASSITWARTSGALTDADRADLVAYKIGYQP